MKKLVLNRATEIFPAVKISSVSRNVFLINNIFPLENFTLGISIIISILSIIILGL